MAWLPFFNKYPYTNLEQLNLDWLMEKVGHFDARITAVEERTTSLEGRMDTAEGDIDALEGRMDTAEGDIDALEGRMDTAEGDIDALEGRMDTAEGDIDALEGRMDTAEGDIDALEGRMDTAEGDIDALEGDIINIEDMIANQYNESGSYGVGDFVIHNDVLYKCINSTSGTFDPSKWVVIAVTSELINLNTNMNVMSDDINTLENQVGSIPIVEANPGGSGTTLNTITINNTVYEIPSGGGGGGSSVTPNPSGSATDDLEKVDIDGTIYAIPTIEANPVTTPTHNLTSLEVNGTVYEVQDLTIDSTLDALSSNPISNSAVTDAIDDIDDELSTIATQFSVESASNTTLSANGSQTLISVNLDPGKWLLYGRAVIVIPQTSPVIGESILSLVDGQGVSGDLDTAVINNTGHTESCGYVMKCFKIGDYSTSDTVNLHILNRIQQSGNYAIQEIRLFKIKLK